MDNRALGQRLGKMVADFMREHDLNGEEMADILRKVALMLVEAEAKRKRER